MMSITEQSNVLNKFVPAGARGVKSLPVNAGDKGTGVPSLGWKDS